MSHAAGDHEWTMERRVVVFDGRRTSAEELTWLLQGSGFSVLSAARAGPDSGGSPAADGAPPASAHRARELLNRVAMLTHGLGMGDITDDEWRRWPAEIAEANRALDALYADGLSRDFLGEPTRVSPQPQGGGV
jgi:hypothetical protein